MKGRQRFVLQKVNELIAKLGIRTVVFKRLKGTESGRGRVLIKEVKRGRGDEKLNKGSLRAALHTYIHTYFIETPFNRAFQSQC